MILIATDKFKGTLSAREATYLIKDAFAGRFPAGELLAVPVADGGEGTAEVIASCRGMEERRVAGHDVAGKPVEAIYYTGADGSVALDAATVLGLSLLGAEERDVMHASSAPLGQLLLTIIERENPREIFLGIGGTATSDGGAGMLQALGATFSGIDATVIPATLPLVERVDLSTIIPLPLMHFLCDVDVPLVGEDDSAPSAMTFAPQKGLRPADAPAMRAALQHWSGICGSTAPFSGAGGGLISGLLDRFSAVSGADAVIRLAGLERLSPRVVITGEGCVDEQSVMGKITGRLAAYAHSKNIPVIAIGGMVKPTPVLDTTFDAVYSTLSTPASTPAARLHLTAMRVAENAFNKYYSPREGNNC